MQRIFRAWVEDWEVEARKKNDCVSETLLLFKYKGLVFHDPDSDNDFCIWERTMEFRHGRGNGWFLLGVCATNGVEDEAFTLELACAMIGDTPQRGKGRRNGDSMAMDDEEWHEHDGDVGAAGGGSNKG